MIIVDEIDKKTVISIIIATYNAEICLENLLKSIVSQKTEKIECIIIDGGSTDSTNNIISSYKEHIDYWISESDNGIYDAWNKGIKKAKGNWIMFLGADDMLLPGALDAYLKFIDNLTQEYDIISSKLDYVNEVGVHLKYIGEPWNWEKFKMSRMSFAHPGLLHNANLFIKNGLFDSTYKICGDSDFFLRTKGNLSASFMNYVTVKMQVGGMSYSMRAIVESYKIRKKNHTLSSTKNCFRFMYVCIIFNLSKLKQKIVYLLHE